MIGGNRTRGLALRSETDPCCRYVAQLAGLRKIGNPWERAVAGRDLLREVGRYLREVARIHAAVARYVERTGGGIR